MVENIEINKDEKLCCFRFMCFFHVNTIKCSAFSPNSVEELNQEWVAMLDCVEPRDIVLYLGDSH